MRANGNAGSYSSGRWAAVAAFIGTLALLAAAGPAAGRSFGAESAGVAIQPAHLTVAPGAVTTAALVATAPAAGLGAWTVDVAYDPAVLSPASCSAAVTGATALCNKDFAPGKVRVTGAHPTGLTGAVALATLSFTAVGSAGTSSSLTPLAVTFADPAQLPVPAPATSGLVTIQAEVAGVGVRIAPVQATVSPGGQTSVDLVATAPVAGLGAWTVDVAYDPAVVQPVSCAASVDGATSLCNMTFAAGKVRVAGIHPTGAAGTVTLATLGFAAAGSVGASSSLVPTLVTFADPASAPVTAATQNGQIAIVEPTPPHLVFLTQPIRGAGGYELGLQPLVALKNSLDEIVTDDSSTVVTLALLEGGVAAGATLVCDQTQGGTASLALTAGKAAFTGCRIDLSGAGYVLEAAATGATAGQSQPFNVTLAGDTNGDCAVTSVDYSLVVTHFGKTGADPTWTSPPPEAYRADLNGNLRVSAVDYSIAVTRFGATAATCAPPSNTTA